MEVYTFAPLLADDRGALIKMLQASLTKRMLSYDS